jgi:hypothetical protein
MSQSGILWYRRGRSIGEGLVDVSSHLNDLHADGQAVDEADEPSDVDKVWHATESAVGIMNVSIEPRAIPGAPAVWFVFVPEPKAEPAAANLVAYRIDALPPELTMPAGTVVSANRFPVLGVPNDAQLAAIRWYPRDGLIHQVFVRQDARRMSLGTVMIYAASAFHQANSWPGRLHGDGRRTDLGDKFVAGLRHPQRYAPLTEVQPPMDPA